jgi:hypothetical protein
MWPESDSSPELQEEQVQASFDASQFGMKPGSSECRIRML